MKTADPKVAQAQSELDKLCCQIKVLVKDMNKNQTIGSALRLREGIVLGRLCNLAKNRAKTCGAKWSDWVKSHIPQYSRRSIEDYSRLAKIPQVERYILFGKAMMMLIAEAIDPEQRDGDPIGEFLSQYDIRFDPEDAGPLEKVKTMVEFALAMRDFQKKNYPEVDKALVQNIVERGLKVDSNLFKHLAVVRKGGGDINQYLEAYYQNTDTVLDSIHTKIRYEHVNDLATRINTVIDSFSNKEDLIREVNKEILGKLIEKVNDLLELYELQQNEVKA